MVLANVRTSNAIYIDRQTKSCQSQLMCWLVGWIGLDWIVSIASYLDLENPDRAQRQKRADIAGGQQQLMFG
jgi:hypothetical protein